MGPKLEENDGQTIAENLMDSILKEVTRSITDRTDSCFGSFESLKLQTFGSEDILDYEGSKWKSYRKAKEYECHDNVNASFQVNDICHPSVANLTDVCVHSFSKLNTIKQGEGDFQHPSIREAETFYRLETEEYDDRPSGSKDYRSCCGTTLLIEHLPKDAKDFDASQLSLETEEEGDCVNGRREHTNSSSSCLTTKTSYDELIEDLQRDMNNVSFDNVYLSDNDDGSQATQRSTAGSNTPIRDSSCCREMEGCIFLFDDKSMLQQDIKQPYHFSNKKTCLHKSKKFCQFNGVHVFPHNDIPSNYCQLVDENYNKYDSITNEEGEETLLSDGSSEELVIIESDGIDRITADNCYSQADNCKDPFLCSVTPSTVVLRQCPSCTPGPSYKLLELSDNKNRISVVADVEPKNDLINWEEDLEVQVNVTEPIKTGELEDSEDCSLVKTRKYWTSVGLVTEKNVDPKYASFISDDTVGIESVRGILRVQDTRQKRDHQKEDEILKYDKVIERDTNGKLNQNLGEHNKIKCENPSRKYHTQNYCIEQEQYGEYLSGDNEVNHNSMEAARNDKKKNKFVSRLTRSLTNLFRSKRKNPK